MMIIVHGEHVETPLARRWHAAEIFASHVSEFSPLFRANGRFSRFYIACGSGLHFDKTQDTFVPTADSNLSMTARRTIVASHHHVPELAQIKVGIFFAPSAGFLMLGCGIGSKNLCSDAIEKPDDGVSEESG